MDTGNLLGVSYSVFLLAAWWILNVKMPKFQLATKFLPLHSLQQQHLSYSFLRLSGIPCKGGGGWDNFLGQCLAGSICVKWMPSLPRYRSQFSEQASQG